MFVPALCNGWSLCFSQFFSMDFYINEPKRDFFYIGLSAAYCRDCSFNSMRCLDGRVRMGSIRKRGHHLFLCPNGQAFELQYGNDGYPKTHQWWAWPQTAAVDLAH